MADLSTARQNDIATTTPEHAEQIKLSSAEGLVYKAYRRPFAGGSSVIVLLASGYYLNGGWEIFFQPVSDGRYQLMEKVPPVTFSLVTFLAASYSSSSGEFVGDKITVVDAYGEHEVEVAEL